METKPSEDPTGRLPRTAKTLYVVSEKIAMIAGIGFIIQLGYAVGLPLFSTSTQTPFILSEYLTRLWVLPLPFLILLLISGLTHRAIASRYSFSKKNLPTSSK